MSKVLTPDGKFSTEAARDLLFQLKREVREQYGIDLDLKLVVESAIKILRDMNAFSETEIEIIHDFYENLIDRKVCMGFRDQRQPELELPGDMAIGYAGLLSGALLCLKPLGITQGIGVGLLSGGVVLVAQSAGRGERPYYVDPHTGHHIVPNSGVGIRF